MSWSPAFLGKLEGRRLRPHFLLEAVEGSEFQPGVGTIALSSHQMAGYTQGLGAIGNSVSAGQVQIGDWSTSVSEITLGYRGKIDIRQSVARGQLLKLRVGWPGWAPGDYEAVFVGHVQNIQRSGDDWTITLRSIVASLISRMTQTLELTALFCDVAESTLASGYTAIAGVGASSVVVVSAVDSEKETGGDRLLQIFPDTGEDPFFVVATFLAGSTFTVDTAAILGTTCFTSAAGSRVVYCAYVHDDPVDAIRKIMTSTGAGSNGNYDTLPRSWGVGIPTNILDNDDMDLTQAVVKPTGVVTPVWEVYSTEAQDDGLAFVQGVLGPAGMLLCERQGKITVRGVNPSNVRFYDVERVTDADIISIDRQETWDSGTPLEYGYLSAQTPNGSADADGEGLESRPASAARYLYLDYIEDDANDWRDSVLERCTPWSTRIPEIVEIRCLGLRLAKLTACDCVEISSRHFKTRDRATLPSLMILSVETDWWGGTVRILAAYHPPTAAEF